MNRGRGPMKRSAGEDMPTYRAVACNRSWARGRITR